ncbi:MAG: hypothetical protein HKN87_07215 [Saprospiraceae bacterium]|nr:hypothetical protein [Saprospiraceae bacterium]
MSAFIVPPNGLIAQIVKVDKDWPEGDTNAWQGTVDLETASIRNTQSISQLAGGIQISHSWRKNVAMCIANLRLMYVDRAPLENGGFLHFRYIKGVDSLWAIEGFSQFQFDQLLKIKLRWVLVVD